MAKKKFFNTKRKPEKVHLVFDQNDRKSFLTGFQKRKAERRLKAKESLEKELKEEKLRIKQRQKERLNKLYENQRTVPEVQHLLEPTLTYELPQQTVNITTFDANDISGQLGFSLGINKDDNNSQNNFEDIDNQKISQNDSDSDSDPDDSDSHPNDLPQKIIDVQKSLKKQRVQAIKSSKAFQTQQKLKHKKDISKSKQRRKLLKKEMRQMKTKSINKNKSSKKKNNGKNKKFSRN